MVILHSWSQRWGSKVIDVAFKKPTIGDQGCQVGTFGAKIQKFGTFSVRLAPKKSTWHLGTFLALFQGVWHPKNRFGILAFFWHFFFLNSLKRRLYSEILINLKFSPNVVVPSPSVEENENIGADGEANFCALRSRLNQNKPQAQAPAHSTAADQRPNIQAAELEGIYCKLAITVSINF